MKCITSLVSHVTQSCSFLSSRLHRTHWSLLILLGYYHSAPFPANYTFFYPLHFFTIFTFVKYSSTKKLFSPFILTGKVFHHHPLYCNFQIRLGNDFGNSAKDLSLKKQRGCRTLLQAEWDSQARRFSENFRCGRYRFCLILTFFHGVNLNRVPRGNFIVAEAVVIHKDYNPVL